MWELGMNDRFTAPKRATDMDEDMAWRVWANQPSYDRDEQPWKCVASFRFLTECLAYIDTVRDVEIIYQSPACVDLILHGVRVTGGMPASTQANCDAATGC